MADDIRSLAQAAVDLANGNLELAIRLRNAANAETITPDEAGALLTTVGTLGPASGYAALDLAYAIAQAAGLTIELADECFTLV